MAKRKKTMPAGRQATTDAVKILHKRYVKGVAKRLASLESEREKAALAVQIYNLRNKASLTQKQLADLVGTTKSVISRLEDADMWLTKTLRLSNCAAKVMPCPT